MTKEYRLHSDDGFTKEYRCRDSPCNHSRFIWCEHCGPKLKKYDGPPPTPEQLARAEAAIEQAMRDFGITKGGAMKTNKGVKSNMTDETETM